MPELTISLNAKIVKKDEVKDNYIIVDCKNYDFSNELGDDDVIVVEVNTK